MNEQIIDINRTDITPTTVFHFQHSLRPFIHVITLSGDSCFVDLSAGECYGWDDLECYDLNFYSNDEDDDFKGVAIMGEITY